MWSKLKVRLLSAIIGAVFVIGIIFAPVNVFNIGIAAVCFLSLYELYNAFNKEKKWQIIITQYLAAVALIFIYSKGIYAGEVVPLIFAVYIMVLFVCAVIWNEKIKFRDVELSVFSLIYGVLLILHLLRIRQMPEGKLLIFLPLLGAWMPDTFAYFSGLLFGKRKLIPSISPNKTVAGSVGAVLGCVFMFLIYGVICKNLGFTVNYLNLVILSIICGVMSQFGDLSASIMKRQYDIKDFGNLLPGHGGILDRIDSLVFIAPIVYYFINFWPPIG